MPVSCHSLYTPPAPPPPVNAYRIVKRRLARPSNLQCVRVLVP